MDFELATATVVIATATATIVAGVVTTAAEQEDKNNYPSTTATTKAIITHNQDLLFCLSSHTMPRLKIVLQKIMIDFY